MRCFLFNINFTHHRECQIATAADGPHSCTVQNGFLWCLPYTNCWHSVQRCSTFCSSVRDIVGSSGMGHVSCCLLRCRRRRCDWFYTDRQHGPADVWHTCNNVRCWLTVTGSQSMLLHHVVGKADRNERRLCDSAFPRWMGHKPNNGSTQSGSIRINTRKPS